MAVRVQVPLRVQKKTANRLSFFVHGLRVLSRGPFFSEKKLIVFIKKKNPETIKASGFFRTYTGELFPVDKSL